jgi:hypothetical protein
LSEEVQNANRPDLGALECTKSGNLFTFRLDRPSGGGAPTVRQFRLTSGQMGLLAKGGTVVYRGVGIELPGTN